MQTKTGFKTALGAAMAIVLAAYAAPALAQTELNLSYFMGPKHPMNAAVFTPFAEKLKEVSGGELSVKQFAGGALNSAPPKQYAILLEGVADIAFALPGYTSQLFPITNVLTVPGVADGALDGTQRLWNAYDLIEALGASAVSQPVSVINQNLQNGTIDAIAIDPSAIGSFKLWEPGNFVTVGLPGSGSAFVLLMNNEIWDGLADQEKAWVDEASGKWLSDSGGRIYDAAANKGLQIARDNGVEIIQLSDGEIERFEKAMRPAMDAFLVSVVAGELTGADVVAAMRGE